MHRETDHRVEPADRIRQCGSLRDHWQHLQFPLAHGLRAEDVRGSMTHNMKHFEIATIVIRILLAFKEVGTIPMRLIVAICAS